MASKTLYSILICATLAAATIDAAEHHGNVKFGGLPVPGATVTATQGEKRLSTITTQQGVYTFADLADGAWKIRVEMLCFVPLEQDVTVAANGAAAEWELKLAPAGELLAAAPAPAAPATPATTATASTPAPAAPAANGKKAKAPKNAPAQAANTSTAFQRAELSATSQAPRQDEPVAGGAVSEAAPSDGLLINGSVNNGASSPFAQSAAFGNFRFKQRLYNFAATFTGDSSAFNARSYSLTGQDTAEPAYTHMRGGLMANGPLKIPQLFKRNAPQLTLEYSWARNRNANARTGRMPADAERIGDFTQSFDAMGKAVTAIDPGNNAPFAGNVIPSNRISPQAALLLSLYPHPNFNANSRYNYQIPLVGSNHEDSLRVRGSKSLGKSSLSWLAAYQSTRADNTNLVGFLDTTNQSGYTTSVSLYRRITTRTSGTITAQFTRGTNRSLPFFADRFNISAMAGVTGNNQEARNWGPPSLNFSSGISGLSDAQSSVSRSQNGGIGGSITNSHGSHNVSVGGDFRRQQLSLLSQQDARGSFTFNGAAAGSDFAGFLLGIPDASSIATGNADKYFRSGIYDVYAADDWRLAASLTINAGFRWEYNTPFTERYGRLVNLDVAPGFSAVAPVVANKVTGSVTGRTYPNSLVEPRRGAVQPRIGLSWRPLPASSLVVRAGYGVYYDAAIYNTIANSMAQQAPLSKSLSVQNSAATPLTLANGFIAPPDKIANTYGVDPKFRGGYAQNWQVSLQRDLPFSLVAIATYLGIKGTHAQQQFLPNTYPAGVASPCPTCPNGFVYLVSNGNSTRHSGQFQLRRRLRSGVTAEMSYTYAKALDDAALGGQGSVIAQDWLNLSGERGRSSFDQRHKITARAQYTTGMGIGGGTLLGGWRGGLFKDWTVVTEINAGSGLPLSPTYPSLVRGTGYSTARPDYTGLSLYDAPAGLFLNPAAVTAPPSGRWGNAGRNSITGPSQLNITASLSRTFRVGDFRSADFTVLSSNPLNHVTYSSWNASALSTQFGLPTAANSMRTLTTTIRVRF
jgi:trimeric autotransporter adhesin